VDTPSPPCPSEQLLLDYVEGRLDEDGEAAIDGHLDGCWACTAVLAGLALIPGTLAPPRATTAELVAGTRIDRYELRAPLGAGAMGVVWEAFDPELDRSIAIKLVPVADASGRARAQVMREAQALARLSHPGVVPVLASGVHGDRVWVVMERIDGTTARAWLRSQRAWREVVEVYLAAARALAAAHAAGVVHRDFKPDNVMVAPPGAPEDMRIRVIDFGLARLAMQAELVSSLDSTPRAELERTAAGVVIGTPAYMPPEQLLDAAVDARADQFALAVSLWEGLFGERPFAGASLASLVEAVEQRRVRVPSRRRKVPAALRRVLVRALSPRPEQRFADMDALVAAIERSSRTRRRWLALAAVGIAGVAMFSLRPHAERCTPPAAPQWDEARRAQIVARLGDEPVAAVLRTIDARVDDWHDTWTRVCETGLEERAAFACLEVRRLELDAAIDVLRDADETVRARAAEVTARLPASMPCASSEPRLATLDPEALIEETAQLRAQLVRARALGDGGSYEEAIAIARDVLRRADELQHTSLRIEAKWRLGALLVLGGNHNEAVPLLEAAFFDAREIGHDEVAAGAALDLVEVLGSRLGRVDEARVWLDHAAAALERWGSEEGRLELLRRRGRLAQRTGDCLGALGFHMQALAAIAALADPDDFRIARSIDDLGTVHWCLGRPELAVAYYRDALARRERIYGGDNAAIAYSLNNIGMVLAQLGEQEAAIDHHEWALEILARTHAGNHPMLGGAHNNLGVVWAGIGEHAEAAREFAEAIAVFETLGPAHPEVAMSLRNFAMAITEMGDPWSATVPLERALAIDEHVGDPTRTRASMAALGQVLAKAGAIPRGASLLDQALREGKPLDGYGPRELALAWIALGRARIDLKQLDAAEDALAKARAIATDMPTSDDVVELELDRLTHELAIRQPSSSSSPR
jgi:eukaryotic-like serine/threonine-protein kinase